MLEASVKNMLFFPINFELKYIFAWSSKRSHIHKQFVHLNPKWKSAKAKIVKPSYLH